jgi:hypothetical protein
MQIEVYDTNRDFNRAMCFLSSCGTEKAPGSASTFAFQKHFERRPTPAQQPIVLVLPFCYRISKKFSYVFRGTILPDSFMGIIPTD